MIIHLTKENHHLIEQATKPVVIDVFATWCGPCMDMKPVFEEVATSLQDSYTFATLNVDEARELAIRYGITSIPTLIFMDKGKVLGKETGYMTGDELRAKMNGYFHD